MCFGTLYEQKTKMSMFIQNTGIIVLVTTLKSNKNMRSERTGQNGLDISMMHILIRVRKRNLTVQILMTVKIACDEFCSTR